MTVLLTRLRNNIMSEVVPLLFYYLCHAILKTNQRTQPKKMTSRTHFGYEFNANEYIAKFHAYFTNLINLFCIIFSIIVDKVNI